MRKRVKRDKDESRPPSRLPEESEISAHLAQIENQISNIGNRISDRVIVQVSTSIQLYFDQKMGEQAKESKIREEKTNKATILGAVATFYAMAAIFFVAGLDIFHIFDELDMIELDQKIEFYTAGAIAEIIAAGICVSGIFFLKQKNMPFFRGQKIEKGLLLLALSTIPGFFSFPIISWVLSL